MTQRALTIGLSTRIRGQMGIGWNRRWDICAGIELVARDEHRPDGSKDGYNEADAKAAGSRIAESLKALATQLKSQYARGVHYFVGEALSALDVYWTAFANLLDPLPQTHVRCQMPSVRHSSLPIRWSRRRSTHCSENTAREFFASISVIRWSYSRCLERS